MFRFLYVTDLHGWREGYEALLRFAIANGLSTIVNGGDMLPKGGGILKEQKRFIRIHLRDFLTRCQDAGVTYYAMFGNDDLASRLPYWREILSEHPDAFDLTDGWHELPDGHPIRGVNYVPDAPFGLKDWMVLDSPGWQRPFQTCRAIVSGPNGFEEIEDVERFFAERPALSGILSEVSADAVDMGRAILVAHAPPAGTGMGILGGLLRGKDVGSEAVRTWSERNQPMLTLHGHIHESPDVSGVHTTRIGRTVCHQPGQKAPLALTASIVEIHRDAVSIERRFPSA